MGIQRGDFGLKRRLLQIGFTVLAGVGIAGSCSQSDADKLAAQQRAFDAAAKSGDDELLAAKDKQREAELASKSAAEASQREITEREAADRMRQEARQQAEDAARKQAADEDTAELDRARLLLTDQETMLLDEIDKRLNAGQWYVLRPVELKFVFIGRGQPFLLEKLVIAMDDDKIDNAATDSSNNIKFNHEMKELGMPVAHRLGLISLMTGDRREVIRIRTKMLKQMGELNERIATPSVNGWLSKKDFEFAREHPYLQELLVRYQRFRRDREDQGLPPP